MMMQAAQAYIGDQLRGVAITNLGIWSYHTQLTKPSEHGRLTLSTPGELIENDLVKSMCLEILRSYHHAP